MTRQTHVAIEGEQFLINGEPTYKGIFWQGHRIEGLLLNARMVQGIFDDLNPNTRAHWAYPDTDKPVRRSRVERLTVAVISAKLKAVSRRSLKQLREVSRLVQPETVCKWHRELARRTWTHKRKPTGGRPRADREVEPLVIQMARENGDWGYDKIKAS